VRAETTVAVLAADGDNLEDAFFRLTSQVTDYRGTEAS
jgi:ABC-2 type transport system ATP-binding protein